jgi:antitoxin VapB
MVEFVLLEAGMAFIIENAEAERLIEQLARLEGRGEIEVLTDAVRERLARLQHRAGFVARVMEISRDCAARLSPEAKAIDHGEYLYDENGLPC